MLSLYEGNNSEVLRSKVVDNSIQLTVTSPPYDNLRKYNGFEWDFESVARELYRVTKPGGVVVWVVSDATINGNETGTSFKQALFFKEIGFNLHDTMIWNKGGFSAVGALATRYAPVFEFMFVFSKGSPVFNPIKDKPNKWAGSKIHGTVRQKDSSTLPVSCMGSEIGEFGQRYNIWEIGPQRQQGAFKHPAPFPERLAEDHIISWSNPGDTVLDPFLGSGTTGKMAILNNRDFIGIEISSEYLSVASERITEAQFQKAIKDASLLVGSL